MVVLVLKNIRSQWFGQTDVLFERLRREFGPDVIGVSVRNIDNSDAIALRHYTPEAR